MKRNYSTNSTELFQEVTNLRRKIEDLENANQMKDLRLKNLLSDNQRLAIKVKKLQRCNRNFQQQLDDERFFYEKEKTYFHDEIQNHRKKCTVSTSLLHLRQQRELERACEALQKENKRLEDELSEQNEITYNLYIKFQRVKDTRDLLKQKLNQLFQNYLRVLAEMMEKLDEAREELNSIVSIQFQNLPLKKAKYLQVIRKNRQLIYENAVHKLQVQKLKHSLVEVKSKMQKLKIGSEDTRTIDTLNTSRSQQSHVQALMNSCSDEYVEKALTGNNIKSKQSALKIVESSEFRQTQFCENCSEYISSDITISGNDVKTCDDSANADESSDS